jgi:hypothetical protein
VPRGAVQARQPGLRDLARDEVAVVRRVHRARLHLRGCTPGQCPSSPEDLRLELGLSGKELKALRAPLERCGALVARPVTVPADEGEGHTHSSELARWDQAYQGDRDAPHADPGTALADLVVAGVRASVVVQEAETRRWFSWQWYWADTLIADLIRAGRLRRVDAHLAARPSSAH